MKEFKSTLIKSVNNFNSYIKQDTKKKGTKKKDTKKKDIEKKDTKKKDIKKKDIKNSIKHDAKNNNKPDIELATVMILRHI